MNHSEIIEKLDGNLEVFRAMFGNHTQEEVVWKPAPDKWGLLEILCHLYDEEREDFKARLKLALETPEKPLVKIDPLSWVTERKYIEKDFSKMLQMFLDERKASVEWLRSLSSPKWKNIHHHPTVGPIPAELFLSNWLAHDYLHFRQITFVKYQYLRNHFSGKFDYAGNW